MRKLVFASMIALFAACSTQEKKDTETPAEVQEVASAKYACPMKCEGEKTYDQAGTCPVCKMDLQEVAMAETDSTAHTH